MASSRAAVVLLVTAASLAVALSHGDEAGPKYGYVTGSSNGPENWGKLSPEYKLCGEGKKQSPIDIVTKQAVSSPNLDSLTRTYSAINATFVNNGHDILMEFEGKVGTITVNGKVYSFVKLHWHMPSEHTINGQRFPLELHLVHKSDNGDLAVIGILYQYGAPDSFYYQLKNKLTEMSKDKCNFAEEDSHVAAGLVHMRSLQKRTGSYFRYTGSLTTPPCTENVAWNILGKVRQISKEQVDLLTSLLAAGKDAGRARPTQPLNGRTVQFYNPPNSTISFEM
ncbi:alpha carbonic anhydrase 7-like [Phragmites australis]|uniref:alpha carbonic anhydrase 7-like n=1 Tax=Phragmites australis TaxID=29695 RepID=UPI002D775EBA|nr:alpha carbonic anhydrase 7-like [Phragmites australis]